MKRIYALLIALIIISSSAFSQIKYDDGPIITSGNFVTVGTWGRNNITYSFQNGTSDIIGNDEQNSVRQAFQIWSDYGNLNFTEVTNNADLVILWGTGNHGDGFPFAGINGVLAHAFFPPPDGGTFSGDIHFDDDETWTLAAQATGNQPIDLVTVAAHEIGHAIGLGHSNVACALMNPFYTGSHRYLSQDDVDGIQSIYGNRSVVRATNLNCIGGTFFINNLPNGASVFWTSSNTSIARVVNSNNQGTVSRVGNISGDVRITGTITLPCGTTVVEFMDIHIGIQTPTNIDYSIDPFASCNEVRVSTDYFPDATYTWSYFKQPYSGNLVQFPNSASTRKLTLSQGSGTYNIGVTATNSCGTSNIYFITVPIDCSGDDGYRFSVSPNPATNTITVQQKEKPNNAINEVRIFDNLGNLKKYSKYGVGTRQAQINVADLKTGIYFIEISSGQNKERQQLVIQK